MDSPELPPVGFGHRHIVSLIEETARSAPHKTYLSYPKSENIADGFNDISYSQFANAVNKAAWWLKRSMGNAVQRVTFSYFGPDDPAYPIFVVATIKCGYKVLLPSPRNSLEFQTTLFSEAKCHTVLCTQSWVQRLKPLLQSDLDICCVIAPNLPELLAGDDVLPFPYSKSYEDAKKDEFLILHSSGSTGPPKPITYTIECTTCEDAHQALVEEPGKKLWWRLLANKRNVMGMPCFHSAGVWNCLFFPVWFNSVAVFQLPNRPLSPEIAHQIHLHGRVDGGFYPPSVLQGLSKSSEALRLIRRMSFVMYGGGPLDEVSGNIIARTTLLHNFIGYTEGSAPPRYVVPTEDWNYFEYHPDSGMYADPVDSGIFKVVFKRQESNADVQSMFRVYPKLLTYSPGDLVVAHPRKPNLWKHFGRADDLVVLSTGEKFNPIDMEAAIEQSPFIRSALIYGNGKQNSALILEIQPDNPTVQGPNLIDEIWHHVQTANSSMPTHAKVLKSMILSLSREQTMERAAKGTVQRQKTFQKFNAEIESLYSQREGATRSSANHQDHWLEYHMIDPKASEAAETIPIQQNVSQDFSNNSSALNETTGVDMEARQLSDIRVTVRKLAVQVSGFKDFSDDEDLFDLGLTSLGVSELVDHLKEELSPTFPNTSPITTSMVYSTGTVARISSSLLSLMLENRMGVLQRNQADQDEALLPETDTMEDIICRFSKGLQPQITQPSMVVAITGTTGGLGCYLLDRLYSSSTTKRIYCLNRGADSRERQITASRRRGLSTNWTDDRVTFLQVNISRYDLGLKPHRYAMLMREVDYFIHNAWKLDFNCTLHSFEKSHIAGVRNIIDLASYTEKSARVMFMSSIASVLNWDYQLGPVPEEVSESCTIAGDTGYAQSKYVAERILQQATKLAGVPTTIVRLGQVAGPTNAPGMWSSSDWLPILLRTSKALGAIPKSLGKMDVVDWVPVDTLAEIISEIVQSSEGGKSVQQVFHAVNPQKVAWSCLLPAVCNKMGPSIQLVSYDDWITRLEKKQSQKADASKFPALKLLSWFRDQKSGSGARFPVLDMKRCLSVSKILANMKEVNGRDLERWMETWDL